MSGVLAPGLSHQYLTSHWPSTYPFPQQKVFLTLPLINIWCFTSCNIRCFWLIKLGAEVGVMWHFVVGTLWGLSRATLRLKRSTSVRLTLLNQDKHVQESPQKHNWWFQDLFSFMFRSCDFLFVDSMQCCTVTKCNVRSISVSWSTPNNLPLLTDYLNSNENNLIPGQIPVCANLSSLEPNPNVKGTILLNVQGVGTAGIGSVGTPCSGLKKKII